MYDSNTQTTVEGFILKWTLVACFVGVVLIFLLKLILLFGGYIISGKLILDFGKYIWQGLKALIMGG